MYDAKIEAWLGKADRRERAAIILEETFATHEVAAYLTAPRLDEVSTVPVGKAVTAILEARADERAKIAAWLEEQTFLLPLSTTHLLSELADAIERGEY